MNTNFFVFGLTRPGIEPGYTVSVADSLKSLEVLCFKVDLHCIRFSSAFVRFFFFMKKYVLFRSHFYMSIRFKQTVTYWTKVFRKTFFVKGYSPILKYRSHRLYAKFFNKICINILQCT